MQIVVKTKMAPRPKENNMILHAALKNDGLSIMASDGQPSQKVKFGDNIHMSITGQESGKLKEIFTKLAQGGKVDMPLKKQFWGDTFGMLTDKFGVHWMVNIVSPQEPGEKKSVSW